MAEGLFRHMVANRPDIRVRSAGVSAFPGQPPSPHAVEVLADLRIDISKLRSLPLSEELVRGGFMHHRDDTKPYGIDSLPFSGSGREDVSAA